MSGVRITFWMIKKIIGAVAVLLVGYLVGVRAGFQAAVHDYRHNGAQMLEQTVERQRSDEEEDAEEIDGEEVADTLEEIFGGRGFQ